MKNNFDSYVCHATIDSLSIDKNVCSTSSNINNDICMLKKSVDYLSSTLSKCVVDYKKLESMFQKKQVLHIHAHQSRHTHASHVHTHDTLYAHVYTCTCGLKGTLQNFVMIE